MTESPSTTLQAKLLVDEEAGEAKLVFSVADSGMALTRDYITELLKEQGASNWELQNHGIEKALMYFARGSASEHLVAKRIDASIQLTLSPDDMKVTAHFEPEMGGKALKPETIWALLAERKISTQCVDEKTVNILPKIREATDTVIARGTPPVPGKNSLFKRLIAEFDEPTAPVEDEQGRVDFLAGKDYLTVSAGEALLQRLPPTKGQQGIDIFGQPIAANDGKELPFSKDITGAEFSADDPNILVAKVSGHPVIFADGARVDETMHFKKVDRSVGHINFDGSINVAGDVSPNIKINVTGDVFIKGMVERAQITAGNNIVVGMGITGDVTDEAGDAPDLECVLNAGGSIQARYANLASLTADKQIELREYGFNSHLKSGDKILLGQNGGNGKLVGGTALAKLAVVAKSIGSKAYVHTHVAVGGSAEEMARIKSLKADREYQLERARVQRRFLDEIKKTAASKPLDEAQLKQAKKLHQNLLDLQTKIKDIANEYRAIKFARLEHEEPEIQVTQHIYPNSFLTISGLSLHIKKEHTALTFVKRAWQIKTK